MEESFKTKIELTSDNSKVSDSGTVTDAEKVGAPLSPIPEPPKPKSKKKKIILTLAFAAFNIIALAVVLFLELKNEKDSFVGAAALGNVMSGYIGFFFVALLMYGIHVACDAIAYFALIRQCGYGNRLGLALRVAILGKYYDNITPWSTGGQPFQMAYMYKANIDAPTACSLPIIKYAIRIFFFDAVVIILFASVKTDVSVLVKVLAAVGIFGSTILPLLLVIFSGNVPLFLKVTKWAVGVGKKLKLVKDYDKTVAKAQDQMDSFLAAFKYLGKHKSMIIIIGLVSVVDCIALSSLPYFIIRSFGVEGGSIGFFETLTKTFYVTLSAGLMPTPGASGASEGTFYGVFSEAVPAGFLFWALLFWRLLVFYMPLILGVLTLIFDWFKGKSQVVLVKKDLSWRFKKTINRNVTVTAEKGSGVKENTDNPLNGVEIPNDEEKKT